MSGRFPRPEPRSAFRAALRARLMSEAPAALAPRPAWWSRPWLRPAFAFAAVLLVVAAGTGAAAAASLPGDPAFVLKRAAEEVRLAFAFDDAAKVEVLTAHAESRLAELSRAASRADRAPTASSEYAEAVARLAAAVERLRGAPLPPGDRPQDPSIEQGKREGALEVADAAREKHRAVLESLQPQLPEPAREAVERALQQGERIRRGPPTGQPSPRR